MMRKAFTKGELATYISRWNDEGVFTFRTVKVESCGAKRMTLSNADGDMMGRDFEPGIGFASRYTPEVLTQICPNGRPVHHFCGSGTFKLMDAREAEAFCLELSASWIAADISRLEGCIASGKERYGYSDDHGYVVSCRRDIEKLKAAKPTAIAK